MQNIKITQIEEPWSTIHLEDGSIIKVRYNIAAVLKQDEKFDIEGNPMYVIRGAPAMIVVSVPEGARRMN